MPRGPELEEARVGPRPRGPGRGDVAHRGAGAAGEAQGVGLAAHGADPRERVLGDDDGQHLGHVHALVARRAVASRVRVGVVLAPGHLREERRAAREEPVALGRAVERGEERDLRLDRGRVRVGRRAALRDAGALARQDAVRAEQLREEVRARVEEARDGRPPRVGTRRAERGAALQAVDDGRAAAVVVEGGHGVASLRRRGRRRRRLGVLRGLGRRGRRGRRLGVLRGLGLLRRRGVEPDEGHQAQRRDARREQALRQPIAQHRSGWDARLDRGAISSQPD